MAAGSGGGVDRARLPRGVGAGVVLSGVEVLRAGDGSLVTVAEAGRFDSLR